MTIEHVRQIFRSHDELQQRTDVLKKATEINKNFKNPYVTGGLLRDILLGEPSRDCDVVFEGVTPNQPGVLEAVQEAEVSLGIPPFTDWEFENTFAHGATSDIVDNTIGFHSVHTDFLTLLMYNGTDHVHVGDNRTLPQLTERVYDPRFQGMLNWIGLRGRTYHDVLVGDALRGLYLTHRLHLHPSEKAETLFRHLDFHFSQLSPEYQERRKTYWEHKTRGLPNAQPMLERYGITAFTHSPHSEKKQQELHE